MGIDESHVELGWIDGAAEPLAQVLVLLVGGAGGDAPPGVVLSDAPGRVDPPVTGVWVLGDPSEKVEETSTRACYRLLTSHAGVIAVPDVRHSRPVGPGTRHFNRAVRR